MPRTQPAKPYPATWFGGRTRIAVSATIHAKARTRIGRLHRPRLHGPRRGAARRLAAMGIPYDAYSASVDSAVITVYASAQSPTASAAVADVHTATCGLWKRGDTCATNRDPGSPPSRANANSMRELDVTDDRPQNHIAPMTTHRPAAPRRSPSAPSST